MADFIPGDDPIELRPVLRVLDDRTADLLSGGGTMTLEHTWTAWDWTRWAMPWAALGFGVLGPVAFFALRAWC
jgi:hypothetical protein